MKKRAWSMPGMMALCVLVACSEDATPPAAEVAAGAGGDGGASGVGGEGSGGSGGVVDKAAACASTFGDGLGSVGFARFDGTVVAVVPPAHPTCPLPNSTHAVVQISIHGQVYRMVISMASSSGIERRMFLASTSAPLPGEPWAEGWHPASLDYAADLGLHAGSFSPREKAEATAELTDALEIGAPVSIFATAEDKPDSAHLVHWNGAQHDGAVVVHPTGAQPRWLLYRFSNQTF